MNTTNKHMTIGLWGIGAVVVGSLLFALVSDGSGDSTGRVFLGGLGVGLHVTGIGLVISAAATYLRKSD